MQCNPREEEPLSTAFQTCREANATVTSPPFTVLMDEGNVSLFVPYIHLIVLTPYSRIKERYRPAVTRCDTNTPWADHWSIAGNTCH